MMIAGARFVFLPNEVGEVSPSYGDGGVMGWGRATPIARLCRLHRRSRHLSAEPRSARSGAPPAITPPHAERGEGKKTP